MASSTREIKTVGIISTGVIGSDFAALCLARGLRVIVSSSTPGAEERLLAHLTKMWPSVGAPAGLTPAGAMENCVCVGPTLSGYYDQVDFVQETAPENIEIKKKIFTELDANLPAHVIIASASMGFPSSQFLPEAPRHPERILIGHLVKPVCLVPLVEVMPHPGTCPEVVARAKDFYRDRLGKKPIVLGKELPGLVAARLQIVLVAEAISLVANGLVSPEDVDLVMTEAIGLRWSLVGPFVQLAMAGGGGYEGFQRTADEFVPPSGAWLADIKARAVPLDSDAIAKIGPSVKQMLDRYDTAALTRDLGSSLVQVTRMKAAATGLYSQKQE